MASLLLKDLMDLVLLRIDCKTDNDHLPVISLISADLLPRHGFASEICQTFCANASDMFGTLAYMPCNQGIWFLVSIFQ